MYFLFTFVCCLLAIFLYLIVKSIVEQYLYNKYLEKYHLKVKKKDEQKNS